MRRLDALFIQVSPLLAGRHHTAPERPGKFAIGAAHSHSSSANAAVTLREW